MRTHLWGAHPISVLPVPGGPKRRTPFGGVRPSVNSPGFCIGQITTSFTCPPNRPATFGHFD
eukprot:3916321-Pyramimonas_sp.AAC.1